MHRQDELRELEDTLSEMDKKDAKDPKRKKCLRSRDIDEENRDLPGRDRIGLLDKIEEKTLIYGRKFFLLFTPSGASWPERCNIVNITFIAAQSYRICPHIRRLILRIVRFHFLICGSKLCRGIVVKKERFDETTMGCSNSKDVQIKK